MARVGVLLLNLGGPERIKDVGPFLYNLFSDPEIIRLPVRAFQKPLAWLISLLRSSKSQEAYRSIGGGSPLRRITEQQARELQSYLRLWSSLACCSVIRRKGDPPPIDL